MPSTRQICRFGRYPEDVAEDDDDDDCVIVWNAHTHTHQGYPGRGNQCELSCCPSLSKTLKIIPVSSRDPCWPNIPHSNGQQVVICDQINELRQTETKMTTIVTLLNQGSNISGLTGPNTSHIRKRFNKVPSWSKVRIKIPDRTGSTGMQELQHKKSVLDHLSVALQSLAPRPSHLSYPLFQLLLFLLGLVMPRICPARSVRSERTLGLITKC